MLASTKSYTHKIIRFNGINHAEIVKFVLTEITSVHQIPKITIIISPVLTKTSSSGQTPTTELITTIELRITPAYSEIQKVVSPGSWIVVVNGNKLSVVSDEEIRDVYNIGDAADSPTTGKAYKA